MTLGSRDEGSRVARVPRRGRHRRARGLLRLRATTTGPADSPRDDNNTKTAPLQRRSPARPCTSGSKAGFKRPAAFERLTTDARRSSPLLTATSIACLVAAVADAIGLSHAEAARRLDARGPVDDRRSSRSTRAIVRENTLTLFNLILLGFAVALVAVGEYADLLFVGIVVINSAIGILQELRAKRQLDRLALLVAPRARVIRDGETVAVPVEGVVEGDAVRLEPGEQVVADGPLLEARGAAARRVGADGRGRSRLTRRWATRCARAASAWPAAASTGPTWSARRLREHRSPRPRGRRAATLAAAARHQPAAARARRS